MKQCQIPCDETHRDKFKMIACDERVSMKDLFHQWVDNYPTWPKKYQSADVAE